MRETGIVLRVNEGLAEVAISPSACCGHCGACADGDSGRKVLTVPAAPSTRPGDQVVVEFGPRQVTWAVLLALVVPLAGLVAGVVLGQNAPWPSLGRDLSSAADGFALLALGFGLMLVVDRLVGRRAWPPPRIVETEGAESDPGGTA